VTFRELGFYLRARINDGLRFTLAGEPGMPPAPVAPLEDVLAGPDTPLALSRLLIGRSNTERQFAVAGYLKRRDIPFDRHRFSTFEGEGENFIVDVGSGDRVVVLIAHHDAVPGSPGANDNAAAVGILLHLLGRLVRRPPSRVKVRFLFPAAEELGYLGARAYVNVTSLAGIVGVLSLELCGRGDTLVVWDGAGDTDFLRRVGTAFEQVGRRREESYHIVGRIPVFGSDHRAFSAAGVPAYGLTTVPAREAEGLRRFVLSGHAGVLRNLAQRPVPFDTYHSSRDTFTTLEADACDAVVTALEALVAEVARVA
jgi:Zn-dependent M28 family amino/carboxypeptidase